MQDQEEKQNPEQELEAFEQTQLQESVAPEGKPEEETKSKKGKKKKGKKDKKSKKGKKGKKEKKGKKK